MRDNSEYVACQRWLILPASRKRKTKRGRGFSNGGEPRFTGERSSKENEPRWCKRDEGENEKARRETRDAREEIAHQRAAPAEKFAFHPFQPWPGPFIRPANQFESARQRNLEFSRPCRAKARNTVESRCKATTLVASCL